MKVYFPGSIEVLICLLNAIDGKGCRSARMALNGLKVRSKDANPIWNGITASGKSGGMRIMSFKVFICCFQMGRPISRSIILAGIRLIFQTTGSSTG